MAKKTVTRRKSQITTTPKAGRTHTGETLTERWTAATNDSDGLLAVVRGGSSVRIIDVHTGAMRGEHTFASSVSAIAWGGHLVVAAALHNGSVAVYSPARNSVVATLAEDGNSVDVSCAGDFVFTLDNSGIVQKWDLSGNCLNRVATGVSNAQKILVSRDALRVVVASHRAEVWDVEKAVKVAALGGGHASAVHSLCWASSDEAAVATAADGDRSILVWDLSGAGEPRAVLASDADIESIDAGVDGSIVAVAADGSVSAWFATVAQGSGSVGRAPDTVVRVLGATGTLPVRVARLSRVAGDEAKALLVRGSPMAPLCEVVALADRDGRFDASVELRREPNASLAMSQSKDVNTHAYSEAGANVGSTGPEQVPLPATPSLADRMGQLSVATPASAKQDAMRLPAGTLVRVLVQSLHTDDQRLLDTVLDNSSRTQIVRDTVLQLPPAYVLPLLQQLLSRFHSTPARAARLLPWIKSTLAMHSAYLVSIPSLVPQLAGFCHAIDGRLESHVKLLRLSGRLELASANFRAADARRQETQPAANGDMLPINVYREEDDEDEEEQGTEPPTPVWQAEESTDDDDSDELLSEAAADEDDQWSDNESDIDELKDAQSDSSSSSDDDDVDDEDSEMGSSSGSDNDL
ncbi:Small subunit (SSU) processome component [Coemansia sp. S16]|nr:Small subunit (SSU) processome component [Coemansia sp. S3946]KAJ2054120.1 Small subunit (SSU) processome component [Coemansia sp. S16]KAJ2069760.1 Small subunit (SSU) processome component [Coemansia sp. S2]KAJ2353673.1 Small subunit (SSU) processome component [Coemansia sp. RSA 2673]